MGFNIKSLFVVEEDTANKDNTEINQDKVEPVVKKQEVKVEQPAQVETTNTKDEPKPPTDEVNHEFLDKLCNYLETCKIEGGDYMQLKKAANSEGMQCIPDESVRFQAAFATLKSVNPNLTKDIILSSIDTYINEMNKQRDIAIEQVEKKRKINVGDKSKAIADKQNQIAELQNQIVKLSTEVSTMKEEVDKADEECNRNAREFTNAVKIIVNALESDKKKISEKLVG